MTGEANNKEKHHIMTDTKNIDLRKTSLYALIASVSLSALLLFLMLLPGDFCELGVKVLETTITFSGASLCALPCASLLESRRRKALGIAGVCLATVSVHLSIITIWIWEFDDNDIYMKITICTWFFCVATAHACLLSLARHARRYAWCIPTAYVFVYALAITLSIMIIGEIDDEGMMMRFVGVLSIIVAELSIIVAILHSLSAADFAQGHEKQANTYGSVRMLCPVCGTQQDHSLGEITCIECKSKFTVRVIKDGQG